MVMHFSVTSRLVKAARAGYAVSATVIQQTYRLPIYGRRFPPAATPQTDPLVNAGFPLGLEVSGREDSNLRLPASKAGTLTRLSYDLWSAWQDLNLRHLAPEASTLARLSYMQKLRLGSHWRPLSPQFPPDPSQPPRLCDGWYSPESYPGQAMPTCLLSVRYPT